MKKIITSLMALSLIFGASAQDGMKGTYLLGATQDITSTGWSDIQITPSVGYFVSDNIAVGLGFSLANTNDNGDKATVGENKTSTIEFSPFLRYYMDDKLFLVAGIGLTNGTSTMSMDGVDDVETKMSAFGFNVGAGLSLMWGERVAIEPAFMIGTSSSSTESGGTSTDGDSGLNAGFQIGLSLRM
jgi:outer membrane protein